MSTVLDTLKSFGCNTSVTHIINFELFYIAIPEKGEVQEPKKNFKMERIDFEKHFNFRERIIISIFSKKKISIGKIRKNFYFPGVRRFEIDLLSLIDKLMLNSFIQINEAGTILDFTPGVLVNRAIIHKIFTIRPLTYYLEFVFYISLFNQNRFELKLLGLRALESEPSLECLLYVTLPLLQKTGLKNIRVKILTNFFSMKINTEILVFLKKSTCHRKFSLIQGGLLKQLRGIFTFSPSHFSPTEEGDDLSVFFRNFSRINYKLYNLTIPNKNILFKTFSLIAESTTGCIFGQDCTSSGFKKIKLLFRKKGMALFHSILEEINSGSCVDGRNHVLLFLRMFFLGKSICTGFSIKDLTFTCVQFLRDIKRTFGVIYSIRPFYQKKSIIIKLI